MTEAPYDHRQYHAITDQAGRSARILTRLLVDTVGARSVLDVGCGEGTWLRAFRDECGLQDLVGVDGDWVQPDRFLCPEARFIPHDLTRPLDLGRRFDLVVSVEVAEHIDPAAADTFLDSLTRHGQVIAFSAAIPYQGGQHHVNEQWPPYWVERLEKRAYTAVDCFRDRLWDDRRILWWYAQNLLLFVSRDVEVGFAHLPGFGQAPSRIHPRHYLYRCEQPDLSRPSTGALFREVMRRTVPAPLRGLARSLRRTH